MKLKLTLVRPGNDAVDVTVTAEPTSAIGDIARELHNADPKRSDAALDAAGSMTLRLHSLADATGGSGSAVLDFATALADSGVASGAVVSLAPGTSGRRVAQDQNVAAIVTIVDG